MEHWGIPKQNWKKRVNPLHKHRLKGRVDADKFSWRLNIFTIICVYSYLSTCLLIWYLSIVCKGRHNNMDLIKILNANLDHLEFLSPITLQPILLKMGIENIDHHNKSDFLSSQNQNESKAERKIQESKHKVVFVLRRYGFLILF